MNCRLFFAAVLLTMASCPKPDDPLPPTLSMPVNVWGTDTSLVDSSQLSRQLVETIALFWEDPLIDSAGIDHYRVLYKTGTDTGTPWSIAGVVGNTFGIAASSSQLSLNRGANSLVLMRVFAVDKFDRSGDTSAVCTVSVMPPPTIVHPSQNGVDLADDTIIWHPPLTASFNWTVTLYDAQNNLQFSRSSNVPEYTGGGDGVSEAFILDSAMLSQMQDSATVDVGVFEIGSAHPAAAHSLRTFHIPAAK